MEKPPRGKSAKKLQQGALSFGQGMEKIHPAVVYTRVFRCRKNGLDYLGQVQIEPDGPRVRVEIFNENYFSHFEDEIKVVLESLKAVVLRQLMKEVDSEFKNLIRSFLELKVQPQVEAFPETEVRKSENGFDLEEIFDRLNAEYFDNKIQAGIGWGRDSKKKNRSGFRFGSYDRAKKLIRIHPRLNQEFVLFPVVELTVYHEMCHQWAPSVKRNGVWRDHHADFKAKEKEYRFYQEARRWEKLNWKKFLNPIPEKHSSLTRILVRNS
jgi:hypothetical protein